MNRKQFALLGLLLGGPAMMGGCAAKTGAIKAPPLETRNYQLFEKRDEPKAAPFDFDKQVELLADAAVGGKSPQKTISALQAKDGDDKAPSALDIQIFSQRNGMDMYPPKVKFNVSLADETLLYRNVPKDKLKSIIERGTDGSYYGGSSLYHPGSARQENGSVAMDITHIPKALGNVSASRYLGAHHSLDNFLSGREYDRVREFDIFQRGKLFDDKKKVLHAKFYSFSDAAGIVSLKRDLSQNGFRISPYFLHSKDKLVLDSFSGKEPDFEKLKEIGYIDEEALRLLRYGEAAAFTAGAGILMHATPVGWVLTAGLGTYLYKNAVDFQDVSVFTHEVNLDVPKKFDMSELSDLVNPNIGSTTDMPKVVVPVYAGHGQEITPVGLAVYTFPQYGVQDMTFHPDGSVSFKEEYKRLIFTGKNAAATALIVGTYYLGKHEYDRKCKDCPGGGQNGGPGVGGGQSGGPGVVNPGGGQGGSGVIGGGQSNTILPGPVVNPGGGLGGGQKMY